jgi:hypothetical protein
MIYTILVNITLGIIIFILLLSVVIICITLLDCIVYRIRLIKEKRDVTKKTDD